MVRTPSYLIFSRALIRDRDTRLPKVSKFSDTYDYLLEKIDTMTRKNEGNYQRLDTTIERLHEKQELYQESCHRLQLNEPQIENRIGQILEKILDSIVDLNFLAVVMFLYSGTLKKYSRISVAISVKMLTDG